MKFFAFAIFVFALVFNPALRARPPELGDADHPLPLDPVDVTAQRTSPSVTELTLPVSSSITASQGAETVNALDAEDAAKYLPSLFFRKRNIGDTQAVMATRTWGVSSSARSLIFVDGIPLSALIANNNSIGGPRWGLVAPEEIERIDVMQGPFSAAYAGNSMGAVMEITTRQPERASASLTQTEAWQAFHQYGTDRNLPTHQSAVTAGNRVGKFSLWISGNYQDSESQPLNYVTSATFPTGTSGGYAASNKLGAPANVVGAGGLLHTRMTQATVKAAYDLTPWLRMAGTFGLWRNDAAASTETYLVNAAGQPTFAGLAGFASGRSTLFQQHDSQSLSLRTDTKGAWDFEASASRYRFDHDQQRSPTTVSATSASEPAFGSVGRVAVLDGTGWSTLDVKGVWRPEGNTGPQVVTFGAHDDQYRLFNPTYNTPDWVANGPFASVATEGDGKTRTQALWIQDAWKIHPSLILTAGLRYEEWRAYDGYNLNGAAVVHQPGSAASAWSPKARLQWKVSPEWSVTASVGQAYRFATAAELYQLVSTGPTFTAPNPNLKPDRVLATELVLERALPQGRARVAFFQDDVHDAIVSQFLPLVAGSSTLYSYLANLDHLRARGVEVFAERRDVFLRGLEFSGSITYVDAHTLALSGQASATAPAGSALGRRVPNLPDWRAAFLATYRPDERWAISLGGRYSGMMFTTLDDADVNPNTYQGFAAWFVADVRVNCRLNRQWTVSAGVDNLLNREYFLFHPFPQRTCLASLKCQF